MILKDLPIQNYNSEFYALSAKNTYLEHGRYQWPLQ